jgi:ribosomal protein S17E
MRWGSLEEVKTFGESILDFYKHRQTMMHEDNRKEVEEESSVADRLLRQALGDDNQCFDQTG